MKNLIMLLAVTFSFAMVNAQSSTVKKSANATSVETKSECKPGCEKACCSKDAKKECTKSADAKKSCSKTADAKKSCSKDAATTKSCSGSKTAAKACCSKDAAKSATETKACCSKSGAKKSCSGSAAPAYNKLVSPQDFKSYMDRFPAEQVVDVRTKAEIKGNGMIEGAQNIDFRMDYFKDEISKLDKNAAIMVYCKSGNRSGKAVEILKEMGFKKIYDLDGGYDAYLAATVK